MIVTEHELEAELRNFAQYSRAVVADAVGLARLTWQERAEWADACADAARGAVKRAEKAEAEIKRLKAEVKWQKAEINYLVNGGDAPPARGGSSGPYAECDRLRAEVTELRAGISWARGMCSDGRPPVEVDHFLGCVLKPEGQR